MTEARRRAVIVTSVVTTLLLILIFVGSRGLRDFDSALIGYAVASVFAIAAMTYRYTLWISRPPTWRYFKAGWSEFLSWSNFRRYTTLIPKADVSDLRRNRIRGVPHPRLYRRVAHRLSRYRFMAAHT